MKREQRVTVVHRKHLPKSADCIHRKRLDRLLQEGMKHSLITVLAGPGYGKTRMVADFLRDAPEVVIWLRFLPSYNDPAHFWKGFVAAVEQEMPEFGKQIAEYPFPAVAGQFDIFLHMFAQQVYSCEAVVFVVDDYEYVTDPVVKLFLHSLIGTGLENFTTILITSEKSSIVPFRLTGGQMRIAAAQMAFTADELAELFRLHGIQFVPQDIENALARTDGWPMAVQLLCSDIKSSGTHMPETAHIHITSELFEQHFFETYPGYYRDILILLSLVPYFPIQLVKRFAGKNIDDIVQRLGLSPFVTYDYVSELFTYQKMYHEYLRRKQALVAPEDREALLLAAGDWFHQNDHSFESLDCYWQVGAYEKYLFALLNMPTQWWPASTAGRFLARLEKIPLDRDEYPVIDFSRAFFHMNRMEFSMAKRLLLKTVQRLEKKPPQEVDFSMLGNTYLALADLSIIENNDTGLYYMQKAAPLLQDGRCIRTADVLIVGNKHTFFLPSNEAGQYERMVQYFFDYAKCFDGITGGSGAGLEYVFAAEGEYLRGNMDKATEYALMALQKAKEHHQHDIVTNAYNCLIYIGLYYGNYAQVKSYFQQSCAYLNAVGTPQTREMREIAESWYYLKMEDFENASSWLSAAPSQEGSLPLGLCRNYIIRASWLMEMGEEVQSGAVLGQAEAQFGQMGLWYERVMVHLLRARLYIQNGNVAQSIWHFQQAYEMVYPNQLRMALLEFGKVTARIIEAIRRTNAEGFDMVWLDAIYEDAISYAKRDGYVKRAYAEENHRRQHVDTRLTQREMETLRYMAQGLTHEEIGRVLGISVNGVKKHAAKIYNKLGAVNKADAIHISSVNGLINELEA